MSVCFTSNLKRIDIMYSLSKCMYYWNVANKIYLRRVGWTLSSSQTDGAIMCLTESSEGFSVKRMVQW